MLKFLHRYRAAFLIATVLVVASFLEWQHANGPRQQTYVAAPQVPALAASPTIPPAEIQQAYSANGASQQEVTPPASGGQWDANDTIALFTGLTFVVFAGQLWQMVRTNQHFRVTERAYVKMSHVSEKRDGLQWLQGGSGQADIRMETTNSGRSPARVTATFLAAKVFSDDVESQIGFPYPDRDVIRGHAFLVPSDAIFTTNSFEITPEEYAAVESGDATLIIYGYVDYTDQFGDCYRGGYGRQYMPGVKGINLGFPEISDRLNYDEPRSPSPALD